MTKINIKEDEEVYVALFKSLSALQSIHDKYASEWHLTDKNNPFIDNGMTFHERFDGMHNEILHKANYLKSMLGGDK